MTTTPPAAPRRLLTRRRLLIAVGLVAVLAGVWYWWAFVRLNAEERSLVGTWACPLSTANAGERATVHWTFLPGHDGTCRLYPNSPSGTVEKRIRWWVRGGVLNTNEPLGDIWECLRQIESGVNPFQGYPQNHRLLSVAEGELVVEQPNGTPLVLQRVPAPATPPAQLEVAP